MFIVPLPLKLIYLIHMKIYPENKYSEYTVLHCYQWLQQRYATAHLSNDKTANSFISHIICSLSVNSGWMRNIEEYANTRLYFSEIFLSIDYKNRHNKLTSKLYTYVTLLYVVKNEDVITNSKNNFVFKR
jgi:hypothetical protein